MYIEFDLFSITESEEKLIYSALDAANGSLIIESLKVGSYLLREVIPATGYVLNTEDLYFEVITDVNNQELDAYE